MSEQPTTGSTSPEVEAYLGQIPDASRRVLEQVRRAVRAAAPQATEGIAYDMPAYRLDGRFLVSFAAFKRHWSLFPASDRVVGELGDAVRRYVAGKGTFRFPYDEPVPADLLARIVAIRLEEVAAGRR